ncbi:hypothetical protein GcM3_004019 [Golovinomyces cichoracearum]|uniref:Uncharacterized protein n=1 Tax=Golovinomyces cichoracearum TaxID=62708 RepID=A0A420JB04_9PEZI|nr:hypothetical protein GcM3_004019 [Golovinomyces cichoracearum]
MAHFDVLPDLRNQKLFWRSPPSPSYSFQKILTITRNLLNPSLHSQKHQAEVHMRDKLFAKNEKRNLDAKKSWKAVVAQLTDSEENDL